MITSELFGVPITVCIAMKASMTHAEYLRVGIALMNKVQKEQIAMYNGQEFKYRAKAISNYTTWLNEKE